MSRSDDRVERRLRDLAAFAGDAEYTVSLGVEAYLAEGPHARILRNNGRHILIQVATVAEKLPEDFKRARETIDWVGLARMRNLIAHHYDTVDDRLIFTALEHRIPRLARELGL